jgi:hypothetical protein
MLPTYNSQKNTNKEKKYSLGINKEINESINK